jgi:hypothetical protein
VHFTRLTANIVAGKPNGPSKSSPYRHNANFIEPCGQRPDHRQEFLRKLGISRRQPCFSPGCWERNIFREAFPTLESNLLRLRRIVLKLQFKAGRLLASALTVASLALVSAVPGSATAVSDPPNDFLSTFSGPHNGDLDVVAANVTLNGSNLDFSATLNGAVGQTPGAVYVFGINRGEGTPKFGNIGEGGVIFDSTFVIKAAGGGTVNDLINKTSTAITDVTLSGLTISSVVPVSDLPSEGFNPNDYEFNLWPEAAAANAGNTEISDFAPNNSDAAVSTAPEPTTISLFGMATVGASGLLRRRKRA